MTAFSRRHARCLAALALAACVVPSGAWAQEAGLALDLRGGVAVPTGSFGGDVGAGPSLGMALTYRLGSRTALRAGFGQARFELEGGGDRLVHTGWEVGGRLRLRTATPAPWIAASALFARVERAGAGTVTLSDLAAGVVAAAGIDLPLARRVRAVPSVRWGWLDTRFPGVGLARMRWVVADLGLAVAF